MIDYDLRSDEAVLVECSDVTLNDGKLFSSAGTLVLTSRNILFATTNMFGKVKNIDRHPLSDVKVYDDKAQVKIDEKLGEPATITIFFKNGQISYTANEKGRAKEFVNQLNKVVTGREDDLVAKSAIPGTAFVAETLKGTIGTFKNAFGIKQKEPEKCALNCPRCGASISGIKGRVTQCPYCDSSVQL